jgi:hypothetical protein
VSLLGPWALRRHGLQGGGKASQGGLGLLGDQGLQGRFPENEDVGKVYGLPKLGRSDRFSRGVPPRKQCALVEGGCDSFSYGPAATVDSGFTKLHSAGTSTLSNRPACST